MLHQGHRCDVPANGTGVRVRGAGVLHGLGGALAPAITAQLLGPLTWQQILGLYAIPGLVWAVAVRVRRAAPGRPEPTPLRNDRRLARAAARAERPVRWSKLVTDPQMLLLCFQQFLRAGAMVFFYTWFARFLQETKGLTRQEAGSAGVRGRRSPARSAGSRRAALGLASAAHRQLAAGPAGDDLRRRWSSARACRWPRSSWTDPRVAVLLISIGAFCGMASGVSAYALAIAYGGKRVATVFATMNMCGNLGATLFPVAVGWIVTATGNWNFALLLFAGAFAVAAVCWALLNPKGTLFDEDKHTR